MRGYNDSRVAEQRFSGGMRAKKYVLPREKKSFGVRSIGNREQAGQERVFAPPAYKNRFGK